MGLWKKITGVAVINEVEDETQIVEQHGSKKNKNKKVNKEEEEEGGGVIMSEEDMVEKKAELKYKKNPTCLDRAMFGKKVRMVYVILLCIFLGLILPFLLTLVFVDDTVVGNGYCGLNVSWRFACAPGVVPPLSEAECHRQDCCYDTNIQGDLYAPICFHSIPSEYGYKIQNVTRDSLGRRSLPAFYELGAQTEMTLDLNYMRNETNFGTASWTLQAKIQRKGNDIVRILIWNPERNSDTSGFLAEEADEDRQFAVEMTEEVGKQFNITVIRNATGETLLTTVFGPLIYSEEYMEITTHLPTNHIYGLGQRDNFDLIPNFDKRTRWSLYNKEFDPRSGITYGSHPFFMNFEKTDGNMFGLQLYNSAPVEIGVLPIPAIVFRVLGGVFDLRLYAGPKPRDVTRQYTGIVGRPAMPPFWALGYHLCRTSMNLDHYDFIVAGMNASEIPYESDCIDARLSYPDAFSPLTPEVALKVEQMKNESRKFVLVQYPFVVVGSPAYQTCDSRGALVKYNTTAPYYGQIDKSAVGYPDYLASGSGEWLANEPSVTSLYALADGVMLFRNTPLNQAAISYGVWNESSTQPPSCTPSTPQQCCPPNPLPFHPVNVDDVNTGTICSTAVHSTLPDSLHLHNHNSYGYHHHKRVYDLVKGSGTRRPLVTSQATHPGSGHLGGQLGGAYGPDLVRQRKALVDVMELGLAGISMVGPPICGSINHTTVELQTEWCLRGHQIAAFWPYMVSHYESGHQPRNPPDFSLAFSNQLRYYVRQRYMLQPYLYTLYHNAYLTGAPVVRPLFYEFPEDIGSRTISEQFLLGDCVLVCPTFRSVGNGTSVTVQIHFPPGTWYSYYTGSLTSESTNGTDIAVPTLLTDLNVYVKGGTILPLQGNLHERIYTTEDSRWKPYYLVVALDLPSTSPSNISFAKGSLYLDDGVTPLHLDPNPHQLDLSATNRELTVSRTVPASSRNCTANFSTVIDSVRIFGTGVVDQILVNGVNWTSAHQEPDTGALSVTNIGHDWCASDTPLTVTWI